MRWIGDETSKLCCLIGDGAVYVHGTCPGSLSVPIPYVEEGVLVRGYPCLSGTWVLLDLATPLRLHRIAWYSWDSLGSRYIDRPGPDGAVTCTVTSAPRKTPR